MARLFGNENFDLRVVELLRQQGHDMDCVRDRGLASQGIPDRVILPLATALGRAVLTFDRRDYIRLHRESPAHAGIVVCTDDADFAALAARIHEQVTAAGDLTGQLVRVNRPHRATP